MQRTLFIIIGVVLIVVAVIGLVIALSGDGGLTGVGGTPPEEPQTQEPTPIPQIEVIFARQPIPRGAEFTAEMLGTRLDPVGSVPPGAIQNTAETINKVAAFQIPQGQIIVTEQLRDKLAGPSGDAAFDIPPGHVMVAFPINLQTSVAYAVEAGDVVDVLMTFSVIDIDPDFQTILPNKFSFLLEERDDQGNIVYSLSTPVDEGRLVIEAEQFPGVEFPREDQRPRRVAQLVVQGARVIGVGPWIELAPPAPAAEGETDDSAPPPDEQGQVQTQTQGPQVVSLAITPQDALVLLWARQTEVYMELALRSAGDANAIHSTEAVTLQYMLSRFNITIPPKIEFAIDKSDEAVGSLQEVPTQPTE